MKKLRDAPWWKGMPSLSAPGRKRRPDRVRRTILTMAACLALLNTGVQAANASIWSFFVNAGSMFSQFVYGPYSTSGSGLCSQGRGDDAETGQSYEVQPNSIVTIMNQDTYQSFSISTGDGEYVDGTYD